MNEEDLRVRGGAGSLGALKRNDVQVRDFGIAGIDFDAAKHDIPKRN